MSTVKTLTIPANEARKYYPTADQAFKAVLESTFGRDFFSQKIQDRVGSYEDACAILGLDPVATITPFTQANHIAGKKLEVIIEALNEGWSAEWKDHKQAKYFPWFEYTSSGFSLYAVRSYYLCSYVPSRLCFKNEALARYAGIRFIDLYETYLNK